MPGFAHIIRLGFREGTYGRVTGQYQFTYHDGAQSWVRTFDDEPSLAEFLEFDVVVPAAAVSAAMEALRQAGTTTLTDLTIRESEASAMGLEQLPSDS